jgi:hypothetical protein
MLSVNIASQPYMRRKLPNRLRRFFAKLPLIIFGILVGALIAEVALRLIGYSYPEFYQLDQSRGYALRPGMEGRYRKEGESFVRINSDGLRDREHSKEKPADTIRIAVLGDSYAEAFQVDQEQAFWSVMEKQLQQCGAFAHKKIEVINFGVSGYGTAQELITLREKVWQYSPDAVLLTLTTNNDITDNSLALKKTEEIPYFINQNGTLIIDQSFKTSRPFQLRQSRISRLGRWLKDHLRLVQAINEGHYGFKILLSSFREWLKRSDTKQPSETEPTTRVEDIGIDNQIYIQPWDNTWTDAWNVTELLIRQIHDEVQSHGAQFWLITLSNAPQVAPNSKLREDFMKRIGATDLFYPDYRIKALAEKENIPAIILAPELQAYAEQENVFLHGFEPNIGNGHWNAKGHRIAGELIAKKLCEGGLVK